MLAQHLRDDLHVQQARRLLRQWWQQWGHYTDLLATPDGQLLMDLHQRLQREVIQVAVFGAVGRGKSSLLNALLGEERFSTSPIHGTTQEVNAVTWLTGIPLSDGSRPALGSVVLLDTPGLDEVGGADRARLAQDVAAQVELILFVVVGDITRPEYEALALLRECGKPILLVLNKCDLFPELDRQAIYDTITQERVKDLLTPQEIFLVAAAPRTVEPLVLPDGRLTGRVRVGDPQVDELRTAIQTIVQREGKVLLALNALTVASRCQTLLTHHHRQYYRAAAQVLIGQMVVAKACLIALSPWSVGDVVMTLLGDVALTLGLSRVYRLPLPGSLTLLQALFTSVLVVAVSQMMPDPLVGAVIQAGLAAWATYRVGRLTEALLGEEGSLKAALHQLLAELSPESIVGRIRWEWNNKA
ncbi:MAG: DUF697 domain-containing protein [Synechococcales cyanobacterium]